MHEALVGSRYPGITLIRHRAFLIREVYPSKMRRESFLLESLKLSVLLWKKAAQQRADALWGKAPGNCRSWAETQDSTDLELLGSVIVCAVAPAG